MSTFRSPSRSDKPRGQILALFALSATVLILGVGLVVDGGNALTQRRASQNAADFGALAGARIIAEKVGGDLTTGTDANVQLAITNAIVANGGIAPVYTSPNGPRRIAGSPTSSGSSGSAAGPPRPTRPRPVATASAARRLLVRSSRPVSRWPSSRPTRIVPGS
jgi:Flp pilus assembly protein TadG